jgi:hypothetical protein
MLATVLSISALMSRVVADNAVRSYTAAVHADVQVRSFPPIPLSLDGTYYHKEPDKNKIVFTSGVPFVAQQFSNVYPKLQSPAEWLQRNDVTIERSDADQTTLKLVPRTPGRVDHVDITIDDATGDILEMRWNYVNGGGYAALDQTYGVVAGHRLVTHQSGHIEIPNYTADMQSTFSRFDVGANIPDGVFNQQ